MHERPIDRALRWAKEKGMTQSAFAAAMGVQPANVTNWKARGMPAEHHAKVAAILGHSVDELLGMDTHDSSPTVEVVPVSLGARRVPLISYVQAGAMTEMVASYPAGFALDWLLTDLELSEGAFALEIQGDSMTPDFRPGDRIIVDPTIKPGPGDFVVAKNGDHEATFKKYRPRRIDEKGEEVFELIPLNDDYPTMYSDVTPIRIIGTMVEHRRYRRR